MIVPSLTPNVDTGPLVQTVATRQYGRWAPQFRAANVAAAAHRDVTLKRTRDRLEQLNALHATGLLSDQEYARLVAQA